MLRIANSISVPKEYILTSTRDTAATMHPTPPDFSRIKTVIHDSQVPRFTLVAKNKLVGTDRQPVTIGRWLANTLAPVDCLWQPTL